MTSVAGGAVCVFSPVTLLTVTLERVPDGEDELHLHAGGQGVWMARMIVTLGGRAVLCAPLGGETGAVIRGLLEGEGIAVRAVETAEASPAWIHDRRGGERQVIWEAAPAIRSRSRRACPRARVRSPAHTARTTWCPTASTGG
jgi:1-phosphofructokinase